MKYNIYGCNNLENYSMLLNKYNYLMTLSNEEFEEKIRKYCENDSRLLIELELGLNTNKEIAK